MSTLLYIILTFKKRIKSMPSVHSRVKFIVVHPIIHTKSNGSLNLIIIIFGKNVQISEAKLK